MPAASGSAKPRKPRPKAGKAPPKARQKSRKAQPRARKAPPRRTDEELLIDAALEVAADGGWRRTNLLEISRRAGVGPEDARDAFRSPEDVLDAFAERTDDATVASVTAEELAGVPPKERLLELLLCRLDALAPRKEGIRALARAARASPVAGYRGMCRIERSMGVLLDHAGLAGPAVQRAMRRRVLAVVWLRALRRWLDAGESAGGDPALAKLDRDLRRLDSLAARILGGSGGEATKEG